MLQRFLLIALIAAPLSAASLNSPAPPFSLKNSDHVTRTLSDYKGKVVLINFWASWCAPCQQELPELNYLAKVYAGRKFKVIAINVDQDSANGQEALYKLGLSEPHFEVLWDPQSKVVSAFNIDGLPASYLLNTHGKIKFIHAGFHPDEDPAAWRHEIDSLLK